MFKLPVRKNNESCYPINEIDNLHKEMNRLFDFSFPRFGYPDNVSLGAYWTPAVDVQDDKDNLRVTVDLPGFKKEDIHVFVQDEVLTISGEKNGETENKEDNYVSNICSCQSTRS